MVLSGRFVCYLPESNESTRADVMTTFLAHVHISEPISTKLGTNDTGELGPRFKLVAMVMS